MITGLLVVPALPAGATSPTEPEKLLIGRWEPFAHQVHDEGDADLWVAAFDGTPLRRLTRTKYRDEAPGQWAPHGHWIAFESGQWYGDCDVQIIRPDGRGKRTVAGGEANDHSPTWSPDGRWLAWVHTRPGTSIQTLRIGRPDGSGVRTIRVPDHSIHQPTWSPDGDLIVFTSWNDEVGQADMFTVRPDGSDLEPVTTTLASEYVFDWSPNGRRILYVRYNPAVTRLSTIHRDGRDRRTVAEGAIVGARFAPRGGHIAFESFEGGIGGFTALWNVDAGGRAVKVLAFDGYSWLDSSQCD